MRVSEAEALLIKNGFRYMRDARHGPIYQDDHNNTLAVSRNMDRGAGRAVDNFLAQLSRAVKRRPLAKLGDLAALQTIASPVSDRKLVVSSGVTAHSFAHGATSVASPKVQAVQVDTQAPTTEKPKRKPPVHFDPEVRFLIFTKVAELSGVGAGSIAQTLTAEGYRMPDGAPVTEFYVKYVKTEIREGRMMIDPTLTSAPTQEPAQKEKPIMAVPTPVSQAPISIPPLAGHILAEPSLNPEQRLEVLRLLTTMVPFPTLVASILDSKMSAPKTFQMLQICLTA